MLWGAQAINGYQEKTKETEKELKYREKKTPFTTRRRD